MGSVQGFAQMTSINFDYLTVDEAPKEPIGFIGTGVSIHHPSLPIYGGIRLNNAAVGIRAGYYTFGYHAGARLRLTGNWSFHPRLMYTTGGGAESNDGSGWFVTPAATLDRQFGNYTLGVGAQYSYVSTGVITGSSAYFSLNKQIDFKQKGLKPFHTQLFTNTVFSSHNERNSNIGFIGVGGRSFQNRTYQSVYLTAAVTDLGGYMDVYGGYGLWEQFGVWRFLTEVNFGTGGGGRAPAGGGLLYGAGGEVQYHHNQYFMGGSAGVLKSLNGPFYFSFIGLHLGTDFTFTSTQNEKGYLPMDLSIENGVRTYLGEDGFSNLGIAFRLYRKGLVQLRGESYWAFTDGRGAYAEGLFGLRLQPNIWFVETQVGAGAGGGINLWGAAALAFVNVGFEIPVNDYWDITGRGIYNVYSSQAFPSYGWQLGMTFNIPFNTQF